jgi:SAM-dependent methyltransferase
MQSCVFRMTINPSTNMDTSNVAIASRYGDIAYAALPHPLTHPDRLATVATFLGRSPPDVAHCRVLEVGCNEGANLIPMAYALPGATFVGCDLSASAVDAGRKTIEGLALANIELVEEDLSTLSPALGTFDYVIAHGVYSWVPQRVRDALFALVAKRLSPNGVMFVSFNVLPGCRVRQAAWDVLHFHVDRIDNARARLDAARQLARIIGAGGKTSFEADEALRAEFRAIAERTDSALYHDDLAVPNDPFYFHEFAAHAAGFGLRYLAEAELHSMSAAGLSPEARAYLSTLDPLSREQYLDFVRLRRFRQSLLCRSDAPTDMTMHPQRVRAMHVAAHSSLLRASDAGKVADLARGLDPSGGGGGPVRALLDALIETYPGSIAVTSIEGIASVKALPRPLESILTDAYVSGIVELHIHAPTMALRPSSRPEASALARYQARTREDVTNLLHMRVRIPEPNAQRLLTLADGSRDRAQLEAAMMSAAPGIDRARAASFVEQTLKQFARLALLVA